MYFAMGSGVTPNQASSVIQIPLSYFSQILKRWNQYLECVSHVQRSDQINILLEVLWELVNMLPLMNTFLWC
jgi:hypothetical protein